MRGVVLHTTLAMLAGACAQEANSGTDTPDVPVLPPPAGSGAPAGQGVAGTVAAMSTGGTYALGGTGAGAAGATSGAGGIAGMLVTGGVPATGGTLATGDMMGSAGMLTTGGMPATGGMFGMAGMTMTGGTGGSDVLSGCEVGPVPNDIRTSYGLDPFYQKYADANGLPVATSALVSDQAITLVCQMVQEMVSLREDIRQELIDSGMRFTMIAASEQLSSIPEVNAQFGTSLNMRARGLGSLVPTICAEENILCQPNDLWRGENICVHEYAHTISSYGAARADPTFTGRLQAAYQAAQLSGNFTNTYAIESVGEFWAEGVQDWYSSNLESIPANGIHNEVNTRDELKTASPELYDLIAEIFPEDIQFDDCAAVP